MPPPYPHEEALNFWHESELVNACMKILEAHYCVLRTARDLFWDWSVMEDTNELYSISVIRIKHFRVSNKVKKKRNLNVRDSN